MAFLKSISMFENLPESKALQTPSPFQSTPQLRQSAKHTCLFPQALPLATSFKSAPPTSYLTVLLNGLFKKLSPQTKQLSTENKGVKKGGPGDWEQKASQEIPDILKTNMLAVQTSDASGRHSCVIFTLW